MSTGHRDLRRRLRQGDRAAFDAVYAEHVDGVFTLAHRLTGNWATAEDVTSETFLAAWRTRELVADDDRPLKPWLWGIATHQALNARRSRRRLVTFLARRPREEVVPDFADEAVQRLDDAEVLAQAARVIGSLRRAEAEVLALCVWSGLSYAEAAEALGVPVGTVRSRLSRARARLRALVADTADTADTADHTDPTDPADRSVRGGRP
ncbi:RNA polymerase sigma factor [Nocardioides oleivorans]|uniref:RNA polymerase sigma factor n=1 Tax=Nocardioides oleivorans TaxID=273676 RepID=A0A4Q2RVL5_9ACTN|nr:RNA polymerase sigma factor [Nocardioides oleivorans]RYB93231.1 RNA polymerase sigma factor [Nocardioides oleivorans]